MNELTYINAHHELLDYYGERAMRIQVKTPMPKEPGRMGTVYNASLVFIFRPHIKN